MADSTNRDTDFNPNLGTQVLNGDMEKRYHLGREERRAVGN
jgi:hypothetical protein